MLLRIYYLVSLGTTQQRVSLVNAPGYKQLQEIVQSIPLQLIQLPLAMTRQHKLSTMILIPQHYFPINNACVAPGKILIFMYTVNGFILV